MAKRTKPSVNAINAAVDAASARVLVLSTAHIPAALANEVTASAADAPIARIALATGEYGWLVYTGHGDDYVLGQPQRRGFRYILFDADGEELPQFTLYDW